MREAQSTRLFDTIVFIGSGKTSFGKLSQTLDDATMLRKAGVTQTPAANRPIVVENKFDSIMALLDRIGG